MSDDANASDDAGAADVAPETCDKCRTEVDALVEVDSDDFAAVDWWCGKRRAPTARRVCRDCCRG